MLKVWKCVRWEITEKEGGGKKRKGTVKGLCMLQMGVPAFENWADGRLRKGNGGKINASYEYVTGAVWFIFLIDTWHLLRPPRRGERGGGYYFRTQACAARCGFTVREIGT